MRPRRFRPSRTWLGRMVFRFLSRCPWAHSPIQHARGVSRGATEHLPEPLVAVWQFTWACAVLIVSSRYLWEIGIAGAGR
jgi:hypothetical protein